MQRKLPPKAKLDLRKIPAASGRLSPLADHFSVVAEPTGSLPPEKMPINSALVRPESGEVLRKPSKLVAAKVVLIAVFSLALLLPFFWPSHSRVTLRRGDMSYSLEVVTSVAGQNKGLGGRKSMTNDHGMLFVFSKPSTQCFWMKNMQFSLDIIWLDSTKQVTKIEQNLSPVSYPEEYCGDKMTKYVIELKSGEAKKANINTGDILQIN